VKSLAGLRVLVTRPAHQAEGLCGLLQQAGAQVLRLPLLAVEPVADPAAAAALLRRGHDWDCWIFTSANAVHAAVRLDPGGAWPALAAAGAATAAALQRAGHAGVLVPLRGDGSAGLLDDPFFAAVSGQRILIVSGEDTLPGLAEGLRARGAAVEVAAVYRRRPVAHEPFAVNAALDAADVAIVSSGEALAQLQRLALPDRRERLLDLQLALPSPRVVEKARQAGFRRPPLLPARVSDAAYVELLQDWLQQKE
jgi:uroporphyrinogen-III synthase